MPSTIITNKSIIQTPLSVSEVEELLTSQHDFVYFDQLKFGPTGTSYVGAQIAVRPSAVESIWPLETK